MGDTETDTIAEHSRCCKSFFTFPRHYDLNASKEPQPQIAEPETLITGFYQEGRRLNAVTATMSLSSHKSNSLRMAAQGHTAKKIPLAQKQSKMNYKTAQRPLRLSTNSAEPLRFFIPPPYGGGGTWGGWVIGIIPISKFSIDVGGTPPRLIEAIRTLLQHTAVSLFSVFALAGSA